MPFASSRCNSALSGIAAGGAIVADSDPEQEYLETLDKARGLIDQLAPPAGGSTVGTPVCIAPEIYLDPSRVSVGADVYALGVTMYRLITGRYPFVEKDLAHRGAAWVNGGLYAFSPRMWRRLPGGSSSLERDVLPAVVDEGRLRGVALEGSFFDIGTPEEWERAERALGR